MAVDQERSLRPSFHHHRRRHAVPVSPISLLSASPHPPSSATNYEKCREILEAAIVDRLVAIVDPIA